MAKLRATFLYMFAVLICLSVSNTNAAKILLLPLNINSHYGFFGRIGQALESRQHHVTLLAASNARLPSWLENSKVHIQRYPVKQKIPYYSTQDNAKLHLAYALAKSKSERQRIWDEMVRMEGHYWTQDCVGLMEDKQLFEKMNSSRFDLVIADGTWPGCTYAYPYKLSVPHASFSLPLYLLLFRVPSLPSVYPSFVTSYTEKMTFMERVYNLLEYVFENSIEDDDLFIRQYVPEKPVVSEQWLARQSKIWFYLDDLVFDYPRPSMPNTVDIGDIIAQSANPLTPELEKFVSDAPHGVILMSFGSWFDDLPAEISIKFFKAFAQIRQRVIWKYTGKPPVEVSDNLKLMKWIPQNDLLGHVQVELFITHCGLNSLMETVFHGVPAIGFPITIDQPRNAKVAEARGYAVVMDIADFTVEELVANINKVINDEKYRENVERMSMIFRDKPESGSERVSFWVDHVIKYGDSHLRSYAHEMPLYQYVMLDILAAALLILLTSLVVLFACVSFVCRKLSQGRQKTKIKSN